MSLNFKETSKRYLRSENQSMHWQQNFTRRKRLICLPAQMCRVHGTVKSKNIFFKPVLSTNATPARSPSMVVQTTALKNLTLQHPQIKRIWNAKLAKSNRLVADSSIAKPMVTSSLFGSVTCVARKPCSGVATHITVIPVTEAKGSQTTAKVMKPVH